jgi:hypothetical protein
MLEGRTRITQAPKSETRPNYHVCGVIIAHLASTVVMTPGPSETRTELDSHANMVVLGQHAMIINNSGRTAQVNPFTPDYDALTEVPIVDAAILYECPYTMQNHLLIFRNALSVPSMGDHNLVPPFIMREVGIEVNDIPKIHIIDPDISDHSLYFPREEV